jgi:hypothetical protein
MHTELPEARMELMLWASERGQMLSRTVKGMMMYGSALRQLELLEAPDAAVLRTSSAADGKFRCVLHPRLYRPVYFRAGENEDSYNRQGCRELS